LDPDCNEKLEVRVIHAYPYNDHVIVPDPELHSADIRDLLAELNHFLAYKYNILDIRLLFLLAIVIFSSEVETVDFSS
jgi:hypothetical protein